MRVAMLVDDNKVDIQDIEDVVCGDEDILIKTKFVGICGSDIHAFRGHHPLRKPPVILGHEISGTIVKTGKNVKGFTIGDPVTVMPYQSCGKCLSCRDGNSHICINRCLPGTGNWLGTFSELFVSKPDITFKLRDSSSLDIAALAEPLAVAIHSLKKGRLMPGDNVAVLGAGPIGLLTGLTAKIDGASKIVVTDLFDHNLALARELFDAETYNANHDHLSDKINLNNPDKFDVIFLCGNAKIMIQQALEMIKPGGRIVITAMFLDPVAIPLIEVTLKEIEIIGTQIYNHKDFEKAIKLLQSTDYSFDKLISHILPLDEVQDAMLMVCNPKQNTVKVLLKVS